MVLWAVQQPIATVTDERGKVWKGIPPLRETPKKFGIFSRIKGEFRAFK